MKAMTWMPMAAFAAGAVTHPKIAGLVMMTRECDGRGARPPRGATARPKDVSVALNPMTFSHTVDIAAGERRNLETAVE
jgi:hypothetical protein